MGFCCDTGAHVATLCCHFYVAPRLAYFVCTAFAACPIIYFGTNLLMPPADLLRYFRIARNLRNFYDSRFAQIIYILFL